MQMSGGGVFFFSPARVVFPRYDHLLKKLYRPKENRKLEENRMLRKTIWQKIVKHFQLKSRKLSKLAKAIGSKAVF